MPIWGSAANQPVLANESATGSKQSTGNQSVDGSQQGTQGTTSFQTQVSDVRNMTPEALAALNGLLKQLTAQPNVDIATAQAQLAASGIVAPKMAWSNGNVGMSGGVPVSGGYIGTDEFGRSISGMQEYQAAQQRYQAALTKVQASGGMSTPGTPETEQASRQIQGEISTLQQGRAGYSKDAAFADSKAFIDKATRQLMEQILPGLSTAIEASGTSGNAVAGLLTNDAVARAAENAATLGIKAAVDYGGVFDQQSSLISGLIDKSPVALNALLATLGVAKGSVQQGVTSTSGRQNVATDQTTQNDTSTNTNDQTATKGTKLILPASGAKDSNDATAVFGNLKF